MTDWETVVAFAVIAACEATLAAYLAFRRVRGAFLDPAFWDATLAAVLEALDALPPKARAGLQARLQALLMGGGPGVGPGGLRPPSFNQMLKFGVLNWITKGRFGQMMMGGGAPAPEPEGEGVGGGVGAAPERAPADGVPARGRLGGLLTAFRGR